jgi:hypothetical protein
MPAAVAYIESELGTDVSWHLGTITNEQHSHPPFGRGLSLHLIGPGTDKHPAQILVFEKNAESFLAAAQRAVRR